MIGHVNARREGTIRLAVCGKRKSRRTITAVIDTGYSDALTLPGSVIRALRLARTGRSALELADGSVVSFNVYEGFVIWDGRRVPIDIQEAQTDPLLGMALLDGYELSIQVKHHGRVRINRLH